MGNGWLPKPTSDTDGQVNTPGKSLHWLLLPLSRFSHVQFCATPWTAACQAPLSMGFSRQESWRRLPCSPPGALSTQGLNLDLLHCSQILYQRATREALSLDNMDKQADLLSSSWARILEGRWSASRTFNKHSCR